MENNGIHSKSNISSDKKSSSHNKKQKVLTIVLVCLAFCIVSGVTLAYTITQTNILNNFFAPSQVTCEVIEDSFDGVTKSNVRVKNTGDTTSYIRAAVVVTWMSEDVTKVTAERPSENNDYVMDYGSSNWEYAAHGFFYYKLPVERDNVTLNLIDSCVCTVTPPDGFFLSVEIVASSIQTTPADAVLDNWNSGVNSVNDDGSLEIKK